MNIRPLGSEATLQTTVQPIIYRLLSILGSREAAQKRRVLQGAGPAFASLPGPGAGDRRDEVPAGEVHDQGDARLHALVHDLADLVASQR